MAEEENKAPAPKKKAAPKKQSSGTEVFVNGSSVNVFTTKGRVAPGERVRVTAEEAKNTKGLEPCQ